MGAFGDGRADDAVLELLWVGGSCRLPVFAGFKLGAIGRSKNVRALQVFGGVNVPGVFLPVLLACAFLTRGFRNAGVLPGRLDLVLALFSLLLSTALPSACKCEQENQEKGHNCAQSREGTLRRSSG